MDRGSLSITCLPGLPVSVALPAAVRDDKQLPPGWATSPYNYGIINIAWRLVPNQAHRALTRCLHPSNRTWCKWFNWLYFPKKFRCCSDIVCLKFLTIQWGPYVNNFHSSLECSQYCNMGVDHFCCWLTFLWLVLCLIVLVTVAWQFSHEICYCLMIVYFLYCTFYTVCVLELFTLCILELFAFYEHSFFS